MQKLFLLAKYKNLINTLFMKQIIALLSLSLILVSCGSKTTTNDLASANPIESSLDLVNVADDKIKVTINPGRFTTETATYRLPRIVQGTYDVSDFGSFVENMTAYDYDGKEMIVEKVDKNTWIIGNASKLDKLVYDVNDTFDIENGGGINDRIPFSPAGTNIESDNLMLNLHGFVGYFDQLKNNQYSLQVQSPSNYKRSSALQTTSEVTNGNVTTTNYFAPRYFDITDNPMMYGLLDVEEFQVGNIKIVLN